MFGVVVDEHVVRHHQHVTVHVDCGGDHHLHTGHRSEVRGQRSYRMFTDAEGRCHLEPPHVSGVAGVLQTVLITLEEELEEEPADVRRPDVVRGTQRWLTHDPR